MGEVGVQGRDAAKFLNRLVTNDVEKMAPGRVLYSPMCQPDGGVVDDLLIYEWSPEKFHLVVNASNAYKDLAWLRDHAVGLDVAIADRSSDYGFLAVQGPRAAAIVQSLTEAKLGTLKYYHFAEAPVAGMNCCISRTGYTGEDGFELRVAAGEAVQLTEALLFAGAPHGLELCGLGARDSLRLEAGFPLYGHEIARDISPLTAGLGWTVKLDKGDFIGRSALLAEKENGGPNKVVFFRTGDRRIVRAESVVQDPDGNPAGRVLSGTLSPILNEAIGSALVAASFVSQPLAVDIRGSRVVLRLVKPPFVELRKG
jgi:aminomethyltransferase